ncbi:phage tail protein [Shigella flexneri]
MIRTTVVTATELVEDASHIPYGRNARRWMPSLSASRGQAHRAGLWLIKTELLETQTVGLQRRRRRASPCTGDVIEICDDDYAGISTGGRVLGGEQPDPDADARP